MSALTLTLTFDGHRVRMAGTAEVPLWVAKDVCRVLGLHGATHIARDIPEAEKGIANLATPGGPQSYICVTEGGLYRLISRSRLASAERFQQWLFNEVLPCIRRHGCYPAPTTIVPSTREHQIAAALLLAADVIAEKDALIAILQPKAATFDTCMSSRDLLTVAQVANILHRPNRPLGEIRLFRWMRAAGLLQRDNRPYQEHVDAGRLKARETALTYGRDGEPHIHVQPLVTQAGVDYIRRRLDAEEGQGSLLPRLPSPAGGDRLAVSH